MITCVRKIRILLLKVEECPDFSILQSNYPYVAPLEELASTLKVWIFPNFCHFPWIFASRQRNAPGFSGIFAYIRIFSSIGGVRILTGTTPSVYGKRLSLGLVMTWQFSRCLHLRFGEYIFQFQLQFHFPHAEEGALEAS